MTTNLVLTQSLLSRIRSHPRLPTDIWYFLTAVTISTLNRPEETIYVLKEAIAGKELEEQRRITRRIREALIKSAAVSGLPKVINALLSLKTATPPHLIDSPNESSPSYRLNDFNAIPSSDVFARGQAFFDVVYGENSSKLMRIMNNCGTPDLGAAGRLMYSYFLSNVNVLSAKETMFVTMAGMIVTNVNSTLLNHMRGAINHGATKEEVDAVREVVISICESAGMSRYTNGALGWRGDIAKL